jgi:hypothetical protein
VGPEADFIYGYANEIYRLVTNKPESEFNARHVVNEIAGAVYQSINASGN